MQIDPLRERERERERETHTYKEHKKEWKWITKFYNSGKQATKTNSLTSPKNKNKNKIAEQNVK
jgi:hypothetical protein